MKKNIYSLLLGFLFIYTTNIMMQIKFYNFTLNFLFWFMMFMMCIVFANYLLSIKNDKYLVFKLILCGVAVFLLDNPKQQTIDLFNQRFEDFEEIDSIENAWMYTSMMEMNKSALFPIFDGSLMYAIEISKKEAIFLEYDFNSLVDLMEDEKLKINYKQNKDEIYFKYRISDINFYGFISNSYYQNNSLKLIK
ncbi:hypothetical protein [Anaerorhabdus furcosa]|uniref:Uncharacterized protein n=1 Tax=Anaerorhabdus furcosa TaxID=118967 RepID=A0A1T4Q4L4_9FIRM|nr:hypothetical protein [Anaerorhabdus furcosa]SJZ98679.1 hypothetical protein SAMN02745191_2314 [Anaerorhabdus furcosa]